MAATGVRLRVIKTASFRWIRRAMISENLAFARVMGTISMNLLSASNMV
jgi:hypothetical protein